MAQHDSTSKEQWQVKGFANVVDVDKNKLIVEQEKVRKSVLSLIDTDEKPLEPEMTEADVTANLQEALNTRDAGNITNVLKRIAETLVGQPDPSDPDDVRHGDGFYERQADGITNFINEAGQGKDGAAFVLYLHDGGFSRLVLRYEKGEISVAPSYNSLENVKGNWKTLTDHDSETLLKIPFGVK